MSIAARLKAISPVEIDEGVFKYILIKVHGMEKEDGKELQKSIVRGFLRAEWHADIYDEVSRPIEALGLDCECVGGGRIEHKPNEKYIKVYGYSQGYGKADHEETKKILSTKYTNYKIECSDGGY